MQQSLLTIAGSDSSGGAGVQADLATFAALGFHGASVIAAVTAQDTRGVKEWAAVAPDLVRRQLECVVDDLAIAGVKTGMLGNAEVVEAAAGALRQHGGTPLVCDPVLSSSAGDSLWDERDRDALVQHLFPLASVVTPNVPEAEALTGRRIRTVADAEEAGREILATGAAAVLVKGGHLEGSPATDVLVTGRGTREIPGDWIDTPWTHGTGCVLSSALCGYLARGQDVLEAVTSAKLFLTGALRGSRRLGRYGGAVNPSAASG